MCACQSCRLVVGSLSYCGYDGAGLLSHWRDLIVLNGLH